MTQQSTLVTKANYSPYGEIWVTNNAGLNKQKTIHPKERLNFFVVFAKIKIHSPKHIPILSSSFHISG